MSSVQAHRTPVDLSFALVTTLVQERPDDTQTVMAALVDELSDPLGLLSALAALSSLASNLLGSLAEAIGSTPTQVWAELAPGCMTALDDEPWPWGG